MGYLSLETAQQLAIQKEACNIQDIPQLLNCLDAYLDQWLGYSLLPQEYTVRDSPNYRGLVRLKHCPIISVESIIQLLPEAYPGDKKIETYSASALYDGKSIINLSGYCGCNFAPVFEIKYIAGYDPLPAPVAVAAQKLWQVLLDYNGDFTALTSPYRQIKRIELPSVGGGVKREYNVAPISDGTTLLDIILTPLIINYRQTHYF